MKVSISYTPRDVALRIDALLYLPYSRRLAT